MRVEIDAHQSTIGSHDLRKDNFCVLLVLYCVSIFQYFADKNNLQISRGQFYFIRAVVGLVLSIRGDFARYVYRCNNKYVAADSIFDTPFLYFHF